MTSIDFFGGGLPSDSTLITPPDHQAGRALIELPPTTNDCGFYAQQTLRISVIMPIEVKTDLEFTNTADGPVHFFSHDHPIGRSLRVYGEWGRNELRVFCAYLSLGSSVVDVGANIGTHALAFAHRVGSAGSVLAIEPQYATFVLLERNAAANGLGQLRTLRAAVGAAEGEWVVPPVDFSTLANIGDLALQPVGPVSGEAERIPLIPLDRLNLLDCHLVKVDAKRLGAHVLAGMRETVSRCRPVVAAKCNSVHEAAELLRTADWPDYDLVLLRAAVFNTDNFAKCRENLFGVATETTLLFVPRELRHMTPASQPSADLIAINGLDALAAAILASPRYGDVSQHDRDSAWLRAALRVAEARLAAVQTQALASLEATRAEAEEGQRKLAADAAGQVMRLEFHNAALTEKLRTAQEQIAHAEMRIAALYASTSWQLTAPMRCLARLIGVRP